MSSPLNSSTTAEAITAELRSNATWIREEIKASNSIGYPTRALLDFLLERRINLALVPEYYCGLHFDFCGEFLLISEATRIDSTFGWIVFQLIGNPGRILSFLDDHIVKALLDDTSGRVIFTYQNDPSKAEVELRNDTLIVSGYWLFGTLSECATHFAIPFIDPRDDLWKCALVAPEAIRHPAPWKSNAFKGASIAPYEISGYEIGNKDIVFKAGLGNKHFNPNYSVSRSAIKHLAWSIGLAFGVLDTAERRGSDQVPSWSAYGQKLAARTAEIDAILKELQDRLAEAGDNAARPASTDCLINALQDLCGSVHQLAVDGALQIFVENPVEALDSGSRVSRTLLDALTLSLHGAIRSDIAFLRFMAGEGEIPSAVSMPAD